MTNGQDNDATNDATSIATKTCVSPKSGADISRWMWKPGERGPGNGGRPPGLRARLRAHMEQAGEDGKPNWEAFVASLDKNARKGIGAAIAATTKLLDEEDIPTEIKVVIIDATKRSNDGEG